MSSVIHAIRILSCFTEETPELRLTDVSQRLGLSTSHTHRLLTALVDEGMLRRTPNSGRYQLGLRLFQMGLLATSEFAARPTLPAMEELAELTGETVLLGVRDGYELIFLQQIESPQMLRVSPGLMYRSSLLSTATGQALLAWQPAHDVDAVIRHRIAQAGWAAEQTAEHLEELLTEVRRHGYAVSEPDRPIRVVAAPIRDEHGNVVAALSVAAPSARLSLTQVPTLAQQVTHRANALSGRTIRGKPTVVRTRTA